MHGKGVGVWVFVGVFFLRKGIITFEIHGTIPVSPLFQQSVLTCEWRWFALIGESCCFVRRIFSLIWWNLTYSVHHEHIFLPRTKNF